MDLAMRIVPDREPLSPGRRRTGMKFTREQVGRITGLAMEVKVPEPNVYVPQRQAKEVAEMLTGRKVRCVRAGPFCCFYVDWDGGRQTMHRGENWWMALRSLKSFLSVEAEKVAERAPRVMSAP